MIEDMRMFCGLIRIMAVAACTTTGAALADSVPPKTVDDSAAATYAQRLDTLFNARDWNGIGAAIVHPANAAEVYGGMHWLEDKVDAGKGGMFLPMLLSTVLWSIGNAERLPAADVDNIHTDLRVTAGMMTLYTYEMTLIDGAMCQDETAPGHRIEQVLAGHAATLAYLRTRPTSVKAMAINAALGQEQFTAALRSPDPMLCSWGMDELRAAIAAGGVQQAPSGSPGQKILVDPPSGWKPQFLSADVYVSKQKKLRTEMPALLARLVQ
jgi:hypothetical protein